MSLKNVFILSIMCCFACMHAGQQVPAAPGAAARFGARVRACMGVGALAGAGGYLFHKFRRGATDEQIRSQIKSESENGAFDLPILNALSYGLRAGEVAVQTKQNAPKSSALKIAVGTICGEYATDVMLKSTLCMLSKQGVLPIPGSLLGCAAFSACQQVLRAGLQDFFVRPCMAFGGRVRRFGLKNACGLSRSVSDILGEYPVRINRNGIL